MSCLYYYIGAEQSFMARYHYRTFYLFCQFKIAFFSMFSLGETGLYLRFSRISLWLFGCTQHPPFYVILYRKKGYPLRPLRISSFAVNVI